MIAGAWERACRFSSSDTPWIATVVLFIGSALTPNARGKPRRSEAEGTNSVAVGVGLTKWLGRGA